MTATDITYTLTITMNDEDDRNEGAAVSATIRRDIAGGVSRPFATRQFMQGINLNAVTAWATQAVGTYYVDPGSQSLRSSFWGLVVEFALVAV